jgi:hypothetical protein
MIMKHSTRKGAKFRCYDCQKEWVTPKEKLVYIRDWPTKCPDCGSAHIGYEGVENVMTSVDILTNGTEKELEKIRCK